MKPPACLRLPAGEQGHCDDLQRLCTEAPALLCALDLQGHVIAANQRWLQAMDLSLQDAAGQPVLGFVAGPARSQLQAWLDAPATEQRKLQLPSMQWQARDGGTVRASLHGYCVLGAQGELTGRVLQSEGLSEVQLTFAALEAERQRVSDVLSATGAGVWEWNVATGEVRLCERWAGQLGRSLQSLGPMTVQNTWMRLTHPDDLSVCVESLARHHAGETDLYQAEFRMRHANGDWVWILARGTLKSRLADGSPEWMLGTHLDISGVKQQQAQLRRTQAVLARIGDIAAIGGYEVCLHSRRIDCFPHARKLLDLPTTGELELRTVLARLGRDERRRLCRAVTRGRRAGVVWQIDINLDTADGQSRTFHVTGQQDRIDDQLRIVGSVQDISERVHERRQLDTTLRRLQAANLAGGVGSWTHDLRSGQTYFDPQLLAILGLKPAEAAPDMQRALAMVHPDDRARVLQAYRTALRSAKIHEDEWRVVVGSGEVRVLHGAAIIERRDNLACTVTGAVWDVTKPRQLEQEFARQRAMLQVTLNSISDAIVTTDRTGAVLWANHAAKRLLQADAVQAGKLPEPLAQAALRSIVTERVITSEQGLCLSRDAGEDSVLEYVCSPLVDGAQPGAGAVVVVRDVTEQRRRSDAMLWQATHDSLTGLTNRAAFDSRLQGALAKAKSGLGEHALLYMDLDQFKLVNDACGHAVGDQLLKEVARMVMDSVRTDDAVARLGGDEFAAILEGCTVEQARRAAQGICDRLDDYRFDWGGRRFRIGASVGLVPIDSRWADAAAILRAADSACYAAKDAGRNRVHTWFESDQSLLDRSGEMQWAAALEQALDEDRLVLYAQRIESLADAQASLHIELLVRLQTADGQIVLPGAFMPAAERYDLATRIDKRVIQLALQTLRSLPTLEGIGLVCINLSGKSVSDPLFAALVGELLFDVPAELRRRLCMEITETSAVTSLANARALIQSLRSLQVSVALDDFGAGASSFGYLRELAVDWLKIDGQFVRDLLTDPLDMAAVKCFVEVARVTGVRTVAEFVETQDIHDELRRLGVDCAQGYLVHRAEPLGIVLEALRR
jgi:diguanylate cyclase